MHEIKKELIQKHDYLDILKLIYNCRVWRHKNMSQSIRQKTEQKIMNLKASKILNIFVIMLLKYYSNYRIGLIKNTQP